jgi:hypothetical protein
MFVLIISSPLFGCWPFGERGKMRLAEEHRAEIGAVLQDVGHLFRRVHSGRQSIAVGHVHQMPAGRQSPPLCAHARNEPRQRVRVLYDSNVDFILFVFFLLVGASALDVHPQGRSFTVEIIIKRLIWCVFDSQPNRYTFSRRILIGLMFSCLGDGLLVWRELFLYGMVSFGIGHMFFISAFGFQPLNLSLGIPMYIASMLGKFR